MTNEAEFRAQFERQTEFWAQNPTFLWSSLLRGEESANKFFLCTGWSANDDRAFAAGLSSLTPFQEMFGRIEEFHSLDTYENHFEVSDGTLIGAENEVDSSDLEPTTLPINWQRGHPADWEEVPDEDSNSMIGEKNSELSSPTSKAVSTSLLAGFIGQHIDIWSNSGQSQHRDSGFLIACDARWIQVQQEQRTLMFPIAGVRLVKIHS